MRDLYAAAADPKHTLSDVDLSRSLNATLDAKPKTHRDGARSCYFSDPDGNHVQIIHHPPISGTV